jgi:hypothetical protein
VGDDGIGTRDAATAEVKIDAGADCDTVNRMVDVGRDADVGREMRRRERRRLRPANDITDRNWRVSVDARSKTLYTPLTYQAIARGRSSCDASRATGNPRRNLLGDFIGWWSKQTWSGAPARWELLPEAASEVAHARLGDRSLARGRIASDGAAGQ